MDVMFILLGCVVGYLVMWSLWALMMEVVSRFFGVKRSVE